MTPADASTSGVVVTGLTNGTPYTFTLTALSALCPSTPSAASASVVPATRPERVAKPTVTVKKGVVTLTRKAPNAQGSRIADCRARWGKKSVSTKKPNATPRGLKSSFTVVAVNALGTPKPSKPTVVRIRHS